MSLGVSPLSTTVYSPRNVTSRVWVATFVACKTGYDRIGKLGNWETTGTAGSVNVIVQPLMLGKIKGEIKTTHTFSVLGITNVWWNFVDFLCARLAGAKLLPRKEHRVRADR